MRHFTLFFCFVALKVSAFATEERSITLVPESEMGSRHQFHLVFKNIKWSADSPWFHKPAPVCMVVARPMDLSLVKKEAERRGMIPEKLGKNSGLGTIKEGAFSYASTKPPWVGAGGNPRRRHVFFGVAKFDEFERDDYQLAVVKPLATKEESVAICREWMKKLGIDENEFSHQGDWPGGFEVHAMTARESGTHPVSKENVVALFGQELRFIQQIGGLSAFWSGYGGNVLFSMADGGEFCGLNGCLRAWEKIGDYEVLDHSGVDAALRDGFAWVHDPIVCEQLDVVKVELNAYHSDKQVPQVDFPLIYSLSCKLHGGAEDGQVKTISLPALKQHRNKHGQRPELTEDEKLFLKLSAEDAAKPVKTVEQMTPEELEEFKRQWIQDGGTIIPPPRKDTEPKPTDSGAGHTPK